MILATQQRNDRLTRLAVLGSWAIVFIAAAVVYWPGLGGPFVFDDFGSIAALGDRGGVRDWDTFMAFVFGGQAGPTGRPLALMSFLIDANNWPADSWSFKRTNLVIHLANGALLGLLTTRILRILQFRRQDARWIALISAACWLLHPFLVSTTLYAVQRMAQLSTLFVFAGLTTYLYGRSFITSNPTKAYLVMTASVGLFTLLAILSKENGILLPLLVGVVEITIIASQKPRLPSLNRYWGIVFIVAPSIMLATYLGNRIVVDGFFEIRPPRDFSTYERLLTQPRVLVDYLKHWFIPELYTTGVFQDHFIKSTGPFAPITTALSALLHIAVISVSIIKRHRWPLFAFVALFFYGSHVLESSVLKLELYFEHRNYLAAAFLFLPLLILLQKKVGRQLFFVVTVGAMLLLGGFTRYSATIWADYSSMVEASARKAPTSTRAQAQLATQLYNAGRYGESLQVIDRAIQNIPNSSYLEITRSTLRCYMGDLSARDFEQTASQVSTRTYDPRMFELYTTLVSSVVRKQCPDISTEAMRNLFSTMLLVPQNADPRSLSYSQIQYFVGFVDAYAGEPSRAVAAFEESLRARPGASHAMLMAAHLATGEHFDEALYFSDLALSQLDAESQHALQGIRVSANDIREFQAVVRADKTAAGEKNRVRQEPR